MKLWRLGSVQGVLAILGLSMSTQALAPSVLACVGEAAAFTLQDQVRLETRAQHGARLWSHGPEMKLLKVEQLSKGESNPLKTSSGRTVSGPYLDLKPEKIPPTPNDQVDYAIVVAEGKKQYQIQLRFMGGTTRGGAVLEGCGGTFKVTPL